MTDAIPEIFSNRSWQTERLPAFPPSRRTHRVLVGKDCERDQISHSLALNPHNRSTLRQWIIPCVKPPKQTTQQGHSW